MSERNAKKRTKPMDSLHSNPFQMHFVRDCFLRMIRSRDLLRAGPGSCFVFSHSFVFVGALVERKSLLLKCSSHTVILVSNALLR